MTLSSFSSKRVIFNVLFDRNVVLKHKMVDFNIYNVFVWYWPFYCFKLIYFYDTSRGPDHAHPYSKSMVLKLLGAKFSTHKLGQFFELL